MVEGPFIADVICAPVPHRHLLLIIPWLNRDAFNFDRTLRGEVHYAAPSAITTWPNPSEDSVSCQ